MITHTLSELNLALLMYVMDTSEECEGTAYNGDCHGNSDGQRLEEEVKVRLGEL